MVLYQFRICAYKFYPVTSNSVTPNSILQIQIWKQILPHGIKFSNTNLYLNTSNSGRGILFCDIKFCDTKLYPVTSNFVIPNSILRLQIPKHQILSHDIKFGNTKFYQVTSNFETKFCHCTHRNKSCNFKFWYPVRVEREGLVKMYRISLISSLKIIYSNFFISIWQKKDLQGVETAMEGTLQLLFPCCDKQSHYYPFTSTGMLQLLGLPVLKPVHIYFSFSLCLPDMTTFQTEV